MHKKETALRSAYGKGGACLRKKNGEGKLKQSVMINV